MNDIIKRLLLKNILSEMKKASSNITDLKVKEKPYNKKPFVSGAKINGVNVNFINKGIPKITLKHGLILEASSNNIYWVNGGKPQILPVNNNISSHIKLWISNKQYCLYKRNKIESNLWIKLDDSKSLKFELNDDLEFEFEDLPKNLYEWDEEHFLYYSLKKEQ